MQTDLLTETFWPISLMFASFKCNKISGVVVHTCNPSAWKGEAEGSGVQGYPPPHSELLASLRFMKPCQLYKLNIKAFPLLPWKMWKYKAEGRRPKLRLSWAVGDFSARPFHGQHLFQGKLFLKIRKDKEQGGRWSTTAASGGSWQGVAALLAWPM